MKTRDGTFAQRCEDAILCPRHPPWESRGLRCSYYEMSMRRCIADGARCAEAPDMRQERSLVLLSVPYVSLLKACD